MERLDDLQIKEYRIIQNPQGFCFGMDAVLLANFAKVRPGECMLDLGTGSGVIPILMEAKSEGAHFAGLEIQHESVDMARRSVAWNHLEEKITITEGDIREASKLFGKGCFDVVTSNPPYMAGSHGIVNPNMPKAIARHELLCTLEDVVREAAALLRESGRFYMVHRPFRLVEICTLMERYKLQPKRMRMVHPYVDKEPNMVLIEGMKGAKPHLIVEKPLITSQEPNICSDN